MEMKLVSYLFCVLIFLFTGCISITSLQSGRTEGEGNIELAASATYGKHSHYSLDLEEYGNMPIVEIGGTIGLSEDFDFSININSIFSLSSNIKYQFIGNKTSVFASSLGAEAGISFIMLGNALLYYYYSLPLYLSYHISDKAFIFLTPRYGKSFLEYPSDDNPNFIPRYINHFGISYGISYGKKNRMILELSHFNQMNLIVPTHISIGYAYTFSF
jgi:hypothetical protein